MNSQPRYERLNENDLENGVPLQPIQQPAQPPSQTQKPQLYYGDNQAAQQPQVAQPWAAQQAIPVAQPVAQPVNQPIPQFSPPYIPQQYVSVIPPVPNEIELEDRIKTRNVEFSSFRFIKEGWIFLKPNLCTFFLVTITWVAISLVYLLVTRPIIMSAFPERCIGYSHNSDSYDEGHCHENHGYIFKRRMFSSFFWLLYSILIGFPLASSSYFAVFQAMRNNSHVVYSHFFSSFSRPYYTRLVALGFVVSILEFVLSLLIVPGIWFALVTVFTLPLHREHSHLNIRKSIRYSIKIVHRYFCHFLGFFILLVLLQVLGILAFLVGLFVTIPLAHTSICYAYHHLIGVNGVPILIPRPVAPAHEYI